MPASRRQFLNELKRDETLARIPVVLLTGLSRREDRVHGIEAGADDFVKLTAL